MGIILASSGLFLEKIANRANPTIQTIKKATMLRMKLCMASKILEVKEGPRCEHQGRYLKI